MKITALLLFSLVSQLSAQPASPVLTLTQIPAVAHPLDAVALNAAVTGAPLGTTYTWQWRRDGVALPGATAPSYAIPRVLSRDLGTYECAVTATFGTATQTLTAWVDCTCEYPPFVVVEPLENGVNVIGTAGDDEIGMTRQGDGIRITVAASGQRPSQDFVVPHYVCCAPKGITVDLGPGLDYLECDVATDVLPVAESEFLGGGQPGDTAILRTMTGFLAPQVSGFATVATGGEITGRVAALTGTVPAGGTPDTDHLLPLSRTTLVFSLADYPQLPWSGRLVANEAGRFLGVLPPLPAGFTSADLLVTAGQSTLHWSALGGGDRILYTEGPAPHRPGLGFRPDGPCADFTPDRFPSLLVPFDEPISAPGGGAVCANYVDLGNPALSSSPDVIPGYVRRGRRFAGPGSEEYHVTGPAGVNPGNGVFSLQCWVLRSIVDDRFFRVNQVLLDYTDAPGTTGWRLGAVRGQLYLATGAGSLTNYTTPAAVVPADGAWHLVSVTMQPGTEVRFFLDGAPAGAPVSAPGLPVLDHSAPLRIGPDFYGCLDELEFYNSTLLTPAEIYGLWLAGTQGRCAIPRPYPIIMPYPVAAEFTLAAIGTAGQTFVANLRDPLADTDSDGTPNRLEYAFGTDPLSGTSVPQITPGFTATTGGSVFTLTTRRRTARAPVEILTAAFSPDLTLWQAGTLLSSQPQIDGTTLDTWVAPATITTQGFGSLTETPLP